MRINLILLKILDFLPFLYATHPIHPIIIRTQFPSCIVEWLSNRLTISFFSIFIRFMSQPDHDDHHHYTTYGRNMSPFGLPSAKIIGGRRGIFGPLCNALVSSYSLKFELKLTMCRWWWWWCGSIDDMVFCTLNVFGCAVKSKLASSNLSVTFGILLDEWWSPLPFVEWVVVVVVDAFGLFELWGIAAAAVTLAPLPCCPLDDVDDAEADFFSFASCWAFFERFHFIRRFWNHILT